MQLSLVPPRTIAHSVYHDYRLLYIDEGNEPLWLIVFNSCYQVQYIVITLESLRLRSHCINPSYSLQKAPTFTVLVHPPFYQPLSDQRIPTLDQSTPAI
jgi:hypothetical protein